METRRRARTGRAIRHGHAVSLILRMVLGMAMVLTMPTTGVGAAPPTPPPPKQTPTCPPSCPPPPPHVSTGTGSVTLTNGFPGLQGSGPSSQGNGNGGNGVPGSPGGGPDNSGGGGDNYFTITLPNGTDVTTGNGFDANYLTSCAAAGVNSVQYHVVTTHPGGGGVSAPKESAPRIVPVVYHPPAQSGATPQPPVSFPTAVPPPANFGYSALQPTYGPVVGPPGSPNEAGILPAQDSSLYQPLTPVPNVPPALEVGGHFSWGPAIPYGPPDYSDAPGLTVQTPGPQPTPYVNLQTPVAQPPGQAGLFPPTSVAQIGPAQVLGYPWWLTTPPNYGSAGSDGTYPVSVASADGCASGNSSMLMRNAQAMSGGGGGGRRSGGKIVLSCTKDLSGAVSAAVLTGLSGLGVNVSGLIPFTSCFPVSPYSQAPCPPSVGNFFKLACPGDVRDGWSFGGELAIVSVDIPPVKVVRSPFPRGIVTIANQMVVDGAPTANGPNWSGMIGFPAQPYLQGAGDYSTCSLDAHPHAPPCGGDVRKYEMGAKMDRLAPDTDYPLGHVMKSCWTWGDWESKMPNGCGVAGQHIYETSSNTDVNGMGGTILANGPRVDLEHQVVPSWDLQSYEASIPTFWGASFDIKYEQADVTFNTSVSPSPGVTCTGGSPPPDFVGPWVSCNANGQPGWEPGTLIYIPVITWVPFEQGWKTIDMSQYGLSQWYFISYRQYECGLYAGREWCQGTPPPGQAGGLPLPILKSNPVLIEPCQKLGICR